MKQINDIHNQQCVKTNSMLSLYGFVEEHEIVVRDGKKEDLRFLYLQLRPSVGLLVYNFYHTHIKDDLQGFDMYMYHSANVKDAIYQYHGHKRTKGLPKFNLLSIQNYLEYTELLINKLLKNILVLQNAFEKTRKQMKVNALIINALSDNLNFPMFAKLTLKKT